MSIAYSFSKQEGRSQNGSLGRQESPSPDAYDPDKGMKIVKEQSPEWTFARSGRPGIPPGGPGPGDYDADINKLKTNVSFTMGSKMVVSNSQKGTQVFNPGPGSYDPVILNKPPQYTMGTKRKEQRPSEVPGPGQYELNDSMRQTQRTGASPFLSKSKRETSLVDQASMSQVFYSPGPGAYSPKEEYVKPKNPTYGIHKSRPITSRDLSPGPGAYDGSSKEMGKGLSNVTFKGRPQTAKVNDIPGPGQYDTNHKTITQVTKSQRGVSSLMNKSERLVSIPKDQLMSPGPGAYDAKIDFVKDKSAKNIGFGKTSRSGFVNKEDKLKPGPGNYEIKDNKGNKGFKIGQKINNSFKNQAPGPGNYDPNVNVVKDSIRNVKISNAFSKSVLTTSKSQYIPGPGEYSATNNDFGKNSKSFLIRGKPKDNQRNDSPGPGAYDPADHLSKERIKSANIASGSKREQFYNQTVHNPGPGQYSDGQDFAKSAKSFQIRGKPLDKVGNEVPGPGHYDANEKVTKSSIIGFKQSQSTRKNFVTQDEKSKPGPGQYAHGHKTIGKDVPSFTMGAKREQRQELSPGPGQYDAAQHLTKDSVRNFKMSASKRPDIAPKTARDMPGPGAYDSLHKFGQDKTAFTIQSKRQEVNRDKTPGPGSYDANSAVVRDKTPTYRMGTSQRTQVISKEVSRIPGPGNYDQKNTIGKGGPQYSFQPRNEPKINDVSPGPGVYDPNSNVVKDKTVAYQISKSTRQNLVSQEAISKPGPGAYDSPQKKGGPQYTMGARSKSRQELSPGPGEYDPKDFISKDKTPSYAISKSMRQEIVAKSVSELPGPGQYSNKAKEFGQDSKSVRYLILIYYQFQIRGKPQDKIGNDVPGPGQYQANTQIVKDRVISHKMTLSQRQQIVTKEMMYQPGPGEYDSPKKFGQDAPAVSIRGRPDDNNRGDSPGPGQYNPDHGVVKDKVATYKMSSNTKRTEMVSREQYTIPGPGTHEQKSTIGQQQTYTIGQRPKENLDNKVPGPGQYDPKDYLTKDQAKSSFKIGVSSRSQIITREVIDKPGPGQYESPSKQTGPKYTFGGRSESPLDDRPGPGQYDPNEGVTKYSSPTFKINDKSQRTQIVSKEEMLKPGPGNYSQNKQFGEDAKSFQIRGKPQDKVGNEVPGPGEYEPSLNQQKDRIVSYKMGTSKRQDFVQKERVNSPGPGQYDSPTRNTGPNYTIGGRSESPINDLPGPGQYNPNDSPTKHQNPSFKINEKSQRTQLVSKEEMLKPGPGNYTQNKQFGEDAKSFQIRGKPQDKVGNEVPGPGEYEPVHHVNKDRVVTYKMGTSTRAEMITKEVRSIPGPGQYDSPSRPSGPNYTIGGRSESPVNDLPGPGQYDPNESIVKHQNPSFKINEKSQRTQLVSKEEMLKPGPGNYTQNKQFGEDAKSFQIRGKPQDKVGNEVPGPGEYEPAHHVNKDRVVTYKMGSSTRTEMISKEVRSLPGPGQYDSPSRQIGPTYTIGGRPESPVNDLPGPGQYDPNESIIKHQNPSFKINEKSQRTQLVSKEEMLKPGPGNYTQNKQFGEDAKSFQIRGKPQDKVGNEVPGPGVYDPNTSQNKDRVVSYKMGTSTRVEIISKEVTQLPGPGQYDSPSKPSGPNYTIGGRSESPVNDLPGPGQYDPNESITKYQSPAFRLDSKTSRTNLVSSEKLGLPGPGVYDQHSSIGQGPSVMIRGKPSPERDNNVPGPGTYDANSNIVKDGTGQSFRISQNKREFLSVSKDFAQQPGPGQYDQKGTNNGQSFLIRGKDPINYDDGIPGPGTYEGNPNLMKHNNPSIDFSRSPDRSKQGSPRKDNLPGPGEYDNRDYHIQGHSVIVYSIPKADKQDPPSDTPGPGHYKLPAKFADVPRYSNTAQQEEYRWV